MFIRKRHIIRIPENVSFFYCDKKQLITCIIFLNENGIIKISRIPASSMSNKKFKKIKSTQGLTVALIKHLFMEVTGKFYRKLKFVGVGYRAFLLENFNNRLFLFKLGYSHFIYFKVPKGSTMTCKKFTTLYFSCNKSYQYTKQMTSVIRECRKPEHYKGKGILYNDEKIKLKIGKRV